MGKDIQQFNKNDSKLPGVTDNNKNYITLLCINNNWI